MYLAEQFLNHDSSCCSAAHVCPFAEEHVCRCFRSCLSDHPMSEARPQLKMLLEDIDRSKDEAIKYKELWDYWSQEWSNSWEKKLLMFSCKFALSTFIAIVVLFVIMNATSAPMGVPPPHHPAVPVVLLTSTSADQHVCTWAQVLTCFGKDCGVRCKSSANFSTCDQNHCRVGDQWYFCGQQGVCSAHQVVVSNAFNAVSGLAVTGKTGTVGATGGAAIGSLFGPELVPIGAVLGGALGAGAGASAVAYQFYGSFWCEAPDEPRFPRTAKETLWCAQ